MFWGGSKVLQMCDLCTRCLCITHLGPESAQSNVSDSLVCGLESERASLDLSLSLSFRRVNGDFWRKIIFHFDPEINCSDCCALSSLFQCPGAVMQCLPGSFSWHSNTNWCQKGSFGKTQTKEVSVKFNLESKWHGPWKAIAGWLLQGEL